MPRETVRPWNAAWFCADEHACDGRLLATKARLRQMIWAVMTRTTESHGWMRVTRDEDGNDVAARVTVSLLRREMVTIGTRAPQLIVVTHTRSDAEDEMRLRIQRHLDVSDAIVDAVMSKVRWVEVDELPPTVEVNENAGEALTW